MTAWLKRIRRTSKTHARGRRDPAGPKVRGVAAWAVETSDGALPALPVGSAVIRAPRAGSVERRR